MRQLRGTGWRPLLVLALIAILAIILVHQPPGQTRFSAPEQWLHDRITALLLMRATAVDDRIMVVDIDEASLGELGRWPWPRATIALLFEQLLGPYEAALVGSDILLVDAVEGETLSLADARVVHPIVWSQEGSDQRGRFSGGELLAVQVDRREASVRLPAVRGWVGLPADGGQLASAHITAGVSADGTVRQMAPIVCSEAGMCVESLALSLYRRLLGVAPHYRLEGRALHLLGAPAAEHRGPPVAYLESSGEAWLAWTGYASEALYVSAVDVLRSRLPRERLAGRVVLVGSSAVGLHDQISTPFAAVYPSLEVHRNSLAALLDGRADYTPEAARLWEALAAMILVVAMWWVYLRTGPGWATAIGAAVLAVWLAGLVAARSQGVYLPFGTLLLAFIGCAFVTTAIVFPLDVRRHRALLLQRMAVYVAPQVLQRLQREPESGHLRHHQRCTVTVLFADVRGYTRFSETVGAVELARVTRLLMTALTEVVLRHQGTVDKYMGDTIMAFWGAPLPGQHQAERAVVAAVDMLEAISQLNQEGKLPGLRIGIGINTGDAVVGDMGSEFRFDYTVIGPSVNVASYLESGTRDSRFNLIIGPLTWQQSPTAQRLPSETVRVQAKGLAYEARAYAL